MKEIKEHTHTKTQNETSMCEDWKNQTVKMFSPSKWSVDLMISSLTHKRQQN